MKLAQTFENVHWLFDPVLNHGLTNLMDCFETHGVNVNLRRAVKIGRSGVNTAVTLTIKDAEIREGHDDHGRDVNFVLKRREQDGDTFARAHVDVNFETRIVANLLDRDECRDFAGDLLQIMEKRGLTMAVPALAAPACN